MAWYSRTTGIGIACFDVMTDAKEGDFCPAPVCRAGLQGGVLKFQFTGEGLCLVCSLYHEHSRSATVGEKIAFFLRYPKSYLSPEPE